MVARVLAQLGGRTHRVALVVPDAVAKVSLLRLETVPSRAADLREIVKWQVRKSVPFPVEQAILSVTPGAPSTEGGREFVVALAREDVVRQYEAGVRHGQSGGGAGRPGDVRHPQQRGRRWWCPRRRLAAGARGRQLLTLAVVRGEHLIFIRHRSEESEGTLADLIHQTAMYYEDRLKGSGFARVWLAGTAALAGADSVRRDLETRLGIGVESVDPRTAAALVDRIGASPELADALAPLVGVLRRDGRAA